MGAGGMMGGGPPPAFMPRNDAERRAVEDLLRKMREGMGERKERKEEKREFKRENETAVPQTKARVVVTLPAEARLWVDQMECPLPGAVRSFDTPDLSPQQNYAYTLRIAVQRNGQTVEESRRVALVPGERVEVDFTGVGAIRTAQN